MSLVSEMWIWVSEQDQLTSELNSLSSVDLGAPGGVAKAQTQQGIVQGRMLLLDALKEWLNSHERDD
jgi:hypothetical protein